MKVLSPSLANSEFNLDFEELSNRKSTFIEKAAQIINELDSSVYFSGRQKCNVLETLLSKTPLEEEAWLRSIGLFQLFLKFSEEWLSLLYFIQILFQQTNRRHDVPAYQLGHLELLMKRINSYQLDYIWDENEFCFTRQIDESSTVIIGENKEQLQSDLPDESRNYLNCLDVFLKLKKSTSNKDDYYKSLLDLKGVLERTIANKIKKSDGSGAYISNTKLIVDKISGNKNSSHKDHLINTLTFIVKNIHHNQPNEGGITVISDFNEKEYIYWWLEINTIIHLVLIS